jgi:lipocalin
MKLPVWITASSGSGAGDRTYGKRQDGGIFVLNRGFDPQKASGKRAKEGYFTGEPTTAALKVSFFGPFTAAITSLRWMMTTSTRWSAGRIATICGFYRARQRCRHRCGKIT